MIYLVEVTDRRVKRGMETQMTKTSLIRYPRLNTVIRIEEFIKEHDGEYRKKQLWEHLPKKMMYQTFSMSIDYLIVSGKVSVDTEGKIGWIFYPKEAQERLKKAHLFWRKPNDKQAV